MKSNESITKQISIKLDHISKSFDDQVIFDDFTHTFHAGETSVVMAPSGRGKTTLLNIITGQEKPDRGSVEFSSKPYFSMVFQNDALLLHTDIAANILSLVNTHGFHLSQQQLEKELAMIGLGGLLHAPLSTLSGGMLRRVAILRAVLMPSNILLLDEPFKGLDEQLKLSVMEYTKKRTAHKTVLLITHDEREALFFNSKIKLL